MLFEDQPSNVRNAADREQVKRASRIASRRNRELKTALFQVMATPEGRRVFWGLLETCGVHRSVWEASAKIHYNAGRQDVGHEIESDLIGTSEEQFEQMRKEARARYRQDQSELQAGRTQPATDESEDA